MSVSKIGAHDGDKPLVNSSKRQSRNPRKDRHAEGLRKMIDSNLANCRVIDEIIEIDRSFIIEFIREFANDPIDFNLDLLVDHLYWEINEREATTLN